MMDRNRVVNSKIEHLLNLTILIGNLVIILHRKLCKINTITNRVILQVTIPQIMGVLLSKLLNNRVVEMDPALPP